MKSIFEQLDEWANPQMTSATPQALQPQPYTNYVPNQGNGPSSSDWATSWRDSVEMQNRYRAMEMMDRGINRAASSFSGQDMVTGAFAHPYAGGQINVRPDWNSQLMMLLQAIQQIRGGR